jgi:ADP-ribose pyrophosphatase
VILMGGMKSRKRKTAAKVLSTKTSFRGKVFSVTTDRVIEPNGVTATRDVVRHSGSVVVLAIDDTGAEPRVLLERQYRYAAQEYLWEIPAGRIDGKEKPLAAAKRELREETGYSARAWRKALFYYPSPGFMDETMTVFLARGLKSGEAQPEDDERIDFELVALSRSIKMIASGQIRDGKTIAAVLWFKTQQS